MTKTWIALAVSLALAACGKEKTGVSASSGGQKTPDKSSKSAPAFVEVNGKKLLESAALMEADHRMTALRSQVPSNRVQQARQQALALVVDQFVKKTLLLEEAERQGIQVSPDEEKNAFSRIQKNLPAGMTVEQVMRNSPIGEARMREEVITGIRIEKLLARAMPVTPIAAEEVDAFIARHSEQLATPETVRARHILLAFGTNDAAEVKAERRKAADVVRNELVKGADFAALAQQRSDCPSRQRGGDLGYFPRGKMVKSFEDAAFSQEVGVVGDVVETPYGYHVIQVTERKPAGSVDREKIQTLLQRQKRDVALDRWLKDLKSKASVNYSPTAPRLPERPSAVGERREEGTTGGNRVP